MRNMLVSIRPVRGYQILGGHTLNGAQILGGHNHYVTIICSKYWVGTCPCAPLVPTGLYLEHKSVLTLTFRINIGTLITIGMGILQKINKSRHPN